MVRWVREQGLAAVPIQEDAPAGTDDEYFRHFMINNALFGGPTYGTTQVISTVIFVCIARRLGLDAHCSVYAPGLMLPLVLSPAGEDLDGKPRAPTAWTNTQVALDPHESASEISSGQLARLAGDVSMTIEALIPATTRQALMAAFDSDLRFGRPRAASSWHDSHLTHAVRDWSLLMAWSRVFAASANFYDWMVATIRHFGNYDLTLTNVALVERILGEFIVRFCGDDPDDADLAHRTHRTLHDWKQTPEVGQCERPGAPFRLGQVVRHHRYGRAGIVFECITEKDHLGYEKDGGRVYYGCL